MDKAQPQSQSTDRFSSFAEFFPFYLGEHSHIVNRWLHFIGTSLAVGLVIFCLTQGTYRLLLLAPIVGYGFAWFGHFFVEKNRPASFKYPLWSFVGDFWMYYLMITGQIRAR